MTRRPHPVPFFILMLLLGSLPMQPGWAMAGNSDEMPLHTQHATTHDHAAMAGHDHHQPICDHCKHDPGCTDHSNCASMHCAGSFFSVTSAPFALPYARNLKPAPLALQLYPDHVPASLERPPRL